jgi:uncharacterized protein YndB with AHSA1/START domain
MTTRRHDSTTSTTEPNEGVTTMTEAISGETIFSVPADRQEVSMSRVFEAPRDLVYRVSTDPDHIPEWWGPSQYSTTIDKADVRPGGQWRYVQSDEQGNQFAFHGVYHDVVPNERVVQTFEFEGVPGHVLLETAVYEDVPGGTRLTTTSVYQSMADRDGMVASGMESGAREGWERLAALIAKHA